MNNKYTKTPEGFKNTLGLDKNLLEFSRPESV
jgi:hypothetical protein